MPIWNRYSIKITMTLMFVIISLASIILMAIISYLNYSEAVKKDFHTVAEEATERLNYHIEFYIDQLSQVARTLQNEELIQNWFEDGGELSVYDQAEIAARLGSMAMNHNEIAGVFLVSGDKRVMSIPSYSGVRADFTQEPWYAQPFSSQRILLPTHTITYPSKNGMSVISIITPVYSNKTLRPVGSFVLDVSLDEISSVFEHSRLGKTGMFMIISREGTIVYHPRKEWLGRDMSSTTLAGIAVKPGEVSVAKVDGTKLLISTSLSEFSGWRVVGMVPFDEMASGLYAASDSTIVAILILACIIVILVPWVSRLFITPVMNLKENIHRVFLGDFQVRAVMQEGKNELMILNASFNRMVEQLDQQIHLIANLELREGHSRLRQKEAYFMALQNQINPHFLYNSLDVIKSIGYLHHDDLVVSMAGNLADVYRYMAKSSDNEVSLQEEMTILEKYLEITRIRYPKHFHSEIHVDPEILDCRIVKLTLQPLVENAVKYVVEPAGGAARICIRAIEEHEDIVIAVMDNGQGIPEVKVEELRKRLQGITAHSFEPDGFVTESLGITNVHNRLCLRYGAKYGLQLTSSPKGTTVSIRIPRIMNE